MGLDGKTPKEAKALSFNQRISLLLQGFDGGMICLWAAVAIHR
jgi:hypothetical protein